MQKLWPRTYQIYAIIALVLLVAVVFAQTARHEFVSLDDPVYVYENSFIAQGLTIASIKWAFTTFFQFWHPLTWLSHTVDITLFGLNPAGHHLHNVLVHTFNSIVLFLFLSKATDAPGKSFFVAALFAIHPLRAESVAWVSERKDVLAVFFGLLCLYSYLIYVTRQRTSLLLVSLLLFAASLMSKPMLVMLPFLLLIFDWFLYQRNSFGHFSIKKCLVQKIPFAMLSLGISIMAIMAQKELGAINSLEMIPLKFRIYNAALSYCRYIEKTILPRDLLFFYPFPQHISPVYFALSAAFLFLLSWLAFRWRREMPLVLFGWLWFVVTLMPMIGLIHVGGQAMADRYTYFTTIGLLIILVWCGEKLGERFGAPRNVTVTIAVLLVLAYSAAAWSQVSYWRDSRTLYNRTLQISPSNYMAIAQLGELLRIDNRFSEAIPYYNQSLQIAPFQYRIFNNIATCYMNIGYVESAVPYLREATRLAPNYLDAHFNLAVALASTMQTDEAIAEYRTVIALSPNDAEAYFQLGECLEALGKLAEAKEQYLMVVRIEPSHRRGANAVARLAR